jgi:GntR family transcriptional regulator
MQPRAREPLHSVIASRAETHIRSGEWAPGSRLPPERELCRLLDVSRSTLRLALAELERRGLIARRQGRGTFVAQPRLDADASSYFTLGAALRAGGGSMATRVVTMEVTGAGRATSDALGIEPGDPVMVLERLRAVDGEPLILETAFLPMALFPGLPELDFAHRSLYDILREDFGREVAWATETLEPVVLGTRDATLLGVARGTPALLASRVTRDTSDHVIEQAQALLRGDRSRFLLTRRVPHGSGEMSWPATPLPRTGRERHRPSGGAPREVTMAGAPAGRPGRSR